MAEDAAGLATALAERALGRAAVGSSVAGLALGLLAVAYLTLAGGRFDAGTGPVVVLLGIGQVAGLAAACACALRRRGLRSSHLAPQGVAAAGGRDLQLVLTAVVVCGGVSAVALPVLLTPHGTALLTTVVGVGVLAQLVVVLAVLRRPLQRAARAPAA
jgi:hypothetical protein